MEKEQLHIERIDWWVTPVTAAATAAASTALLSPVSSLFRPDPTWISLPLTHSAL